MKRNAWKVLAGALFLLNFFGGSLLPLSASSDETSRPSELYPQKFDLAIYVGQVFPSESSLQGDQRLGFEGAWRYQLTHQLAWGLSAGLQALYANTPTWPVLWEGWGQFYWDWEFLKPFSLRFMSGVLGGPSVSAPYLGAAAGFGPWFLETQVLLASATYTQISLGWRWKGN